MKFIEEYRNPAIIEKFLNLIKKESETIHKINLMEVCGTHTMQIGKFGIRKVLPENINLISGPGCPVCVSPNSYIDKAIEYSKIPHVIIATFGDMMKVPGSFSSLEKEKSKGAKIEVVYSPFDALKIAQKNPSKNVVFLGIGFETTSPCVAATVIEAKRKNIKNFFVFSGHKLIPPAMEVLLKEEVKIDGFICPGHVSTIIGSIPYRFIPEKYGIPCVIAGFEPVDILLAILSLIRMVVKKIPEVEIQYRRSVKENGNEKAKRIMNEVFEIVDSEWRGLGEIPESGLKMREDYQEFDAEKKFKVEIKESREYPECICGEILKGLKTPKQCKLFRKVCNPENPVGPCMVSSEGTCAAYYRYER